MKKLISIFLVLIIVLSCGCNKATKVETESGDNTQEVAAESQTESFGESSNQDTSDEEDIYGSVTHGDEASSETEAETQVETDNEDETDPEPITQGTEEGQGEDAMETEKESSPNVIVTPTGIELPED